MKGGLDEIATKATPGWPPEMAHSDNFGILTPPGNPVAPGCLGIGGNQVA